MLKTEISRKLRAVAARHRDNWRKWATDMADGKSEPTAGDVVEAAIYLGIADPAEALERDADIIREVRAADAAVERCEAARAERLAPFGGDPEKILAALEVAKAEVSRLTELYDAATWPHAWTYKARASKLRNDRPDLFPKEAKR